jgi:hypothetical protein
MNLSRDIKDQKLEKYISIIKNNESSSGDKLKAYKKASQRINFLEEEYEELSNNLLKKPKKSSKKSETNDIDKILKELKELDNILNENIEKTSMLDIINNYAQYKVVLEKLETETNNIKNEIMKIEEKKNKITIQKINIDDIFVL